MRYGYQITPPPGRVMGCLPRTTRIGEQCPIFEEHFKEEIEEMTEADLNRIAAEGTVDLSPFTIQLDQDGIGSCATEATAGAIQVGRASSGLEPVKLNPWSIYWFVSGGRDNGSTIGDCLDYARKYGCCPESAWPRSKGWNSEPSAEAKEIALGFCIYEFYDITSILGCRTALAKAMPVVYGARGHALCKVRDLGPKEGLDINSWGSSWGDNGFGVWVPYSEVQWQYGMYAVRVVSVQEGEGGEAPRPKARKKTT